MKKTLLLLFCAIIAAAAAYLLLSRGAKPLTILYCANSKGLVLPLMEGRAPAGTLPASYPDVFREMRSAREKADREGRSLILIGAGNSLTGEDPLSISTCGMPVARMMALIPVDVFVPGFAELLMGNRFLDTIRTARLPCVLTNAKSSTLVPLVVKSWGSTSVALGGFLDPRTSRILRQEESSFEGIPLSRDLQALQETFNRQGAGLNILVAGAPSYRSLADKLKNIDIIIPLDFEDDVTSEKGSNAGGTFIAPPVDSRLALGEISLGGARGKWKIAASVKKLEARSGEDSVPEEVRRAFIEPFRKAVGGALVLRERLVALADWPLASRDRTAAFAGGPLSHDRMLFRQSALGSFVADFMLARTGAEVAMINNLALRKTLDGLVSLDDVMESMPFMNSLVLIDLTGRQVDELARRNTFESRRFLQTSGLEMLYTPEAPQEAKILIAGKAIEPERRYRVVVNDYLATGARGRELIFSKAGTVFRTSTILNLAFIDLCSRMKILFAPGPSVFRMEPVREAKPIEDSVRALLGKGERREAFALLAQSALFSKDDKDVALLSGQERASFEGYLALLRRSPEEALARYTSALERYPGDREILISCGLLYFREGFLRKADALFTRAMEAGGKDGRDALPLLMRGLCRHGMYERKKSAADLEAAARTEPAARALLALTLLYDGDGEGARRHWALLAKGEWQKKKVEEILRLMEARR